MFDQFIYILENQYVGLKETDECMLDSDGLSSLQDCIDAREKHIHNNSKYMIYDEQIRVSSAAETDVDEVSGGGVSL